MKLAEYIHYDAIALAELVSKKEISPKELLDNAINLTEKINPLINAVVISFYDKAYQQIEHGVGDGLFAGVPSLLKNLDMPYEGTLETEGSRYYSKNICSYTSLSVSRLLEQGLVFFGRTNTPEFGLSFSTEPAMYGPTRNPWLLDRTAGGSSGGAAAALASRIVPIHLASDGGGSIRNPAACCGVFGFKPSRGHIASGPEMAEIWAGLVTENVLSRSVRDNAAGLDILSVPPATGSYYPLIKHEISYLAEHTKPPKKLIIGLLEGPFYDVPVAADCHRAVELAIHLFQHLGHEVESVKVYLDLDSIGQAGYHIMAAYMENALDIQKLIMRRDYRQDELEPISRHFAEMGPRVRGSDLITARNTIFQQSLAVARLTSKFDILLTPALAKPPIFLGELNPADDFNHFAQKNMEFSPFHSLFNQTGQPAMTVPIYWNENGLPISIQCAAAIGDDLTLLQLAHQIEQIQPWTKYYPSILNHILK